MAVSVKPPAIHVCQYLLLALCFGLSLVQLPTVSLTIDIKSAVLLAAGILGWIIVGLQRKKLVHYVPRFLVIALGGYVVTAVISMLAHPEVSSMLGEPLLRLGAAGLIACVGCALGLMNVTKKDLVLVIVASGTALAFGAILQAALSDWNRVGGSFNQADILGVYLGATLLLFITNIKLIPGGRLVKLLLCAVLAAGLILSGTRVAIALTAAVIGTCWFINSGYKHQYLRYAIAAFALFLTVSTAVIAPRYQLSEVSTSISYRLHLQQAAVRNGAHQPFFGYGAGNVHQALSCGNLKSTDLVETCRQGYYFNSSHNIYLDRALALGWASAILMVTVVIYCLIYAYRKGDRHWFWPGLVISLYYLTNVTSIELELFLWVILFQGLIPLRQEKTRSLLSGS